MILQGNLLHCSIKSPRTAGVLAGGSFCIQKPGIFVRVSNYRHNHVEAHPYANVLNHGEMSFPFFTSLLQEDILCLCITHHFDYDIIGSTIDDAAGECVDKVAKLFGFPMPGGPVVDPAAMDTQAMNIISRVLYLTKTLKIFSFSGLKTAMLRFKEKSMQSSSSGPEKSEILYETGPFSHLFFKA
ncbi:MAG: hypothetical protein CM1200mP30_04280 [Pseudomonadota bacterium]|nr:MAG: hypothetical protein CM1200mP30_04280 [Pseudomonadota bacterium]